jgi:DNA-binding GntR family transcriptional regulator
VDIVRAFVGVHVSRVNSSMLCRVPGPAEQLATVATISAWTYHLLRTFARHGERYPRYAMRLPDGPRDVHAEHTEIYNAAMAGKEARAALALEAHVRATTEQLIQADQDGVRWFESAGL